MIVLRTFSDPQQEDPNNAGKGLRTAGKIGMAAGTTAAVGSLGYAGIVAKNHNKNISSIINQYSGVKGAMRPGGAGHEKATSAVTKTMNKIGKAGLVGKIGLGVGAAGLAAYGVGKYKQHQANKQAQQAQQ